MIEKIEKLLAKKGEAHTREWNIAAYYADKEAYIVIVSHAYGFIIRKRGE